MRRIVALAAFAALVPACDGSGRGRRAPVAEVLFIADKNVLGVDELFSVDSSGAIHTLSGPLVAGGDVHLPRVSWNGRWVAFLADKDVEGKMELYLVPTTGGTPAVKISGSMVTGGNVNPWFIWSPDSTRVLFRADAIVDEQFDLFVASVPGSLPVRVTDPMVAGGDVASLSYGWADGGSRVVYGADQEIDGVGGVYSWPVAGGTTLNLTKALAPTAQGSAMAISWSEAEVAIVARPDASSPRQIFSVPTSGGAALPLSAVPPGLVGLWVSGSFDASRWAFVEDNDLFTVNADGSARTQVSVHAPVVFGSLRWSADDQFVLYHSSGVSYSARPGVAASEVDLTPPLSGGETVSFFQPAPAGHLLSYLITGGGISLHVKTAGLAGAGTRISGSPPWTVDVGSVHWAPDASRLAYAADEEVDGFEELFTALPSGGGRVKISGPLLQGGIGQMTWSPDASRVYFSACGDDPTTEELYVADLLSMSRRRISGPLISGGSIRLVSAIP